MCQNWNLKKDPGQEKREDTAVRRRPASVPSLAPPGRPPRQGPWGHVGPSPGSPARGGAEPGAGSRTAGAGAAVVAPAGGGAGGGRSAGLPRAGRRRGTPGTPGLRGARAARLRRSGSLSTCRAPRRGDGRGRVRSSQFHPHLRWKGCLGSAREGGGRWPGWREGYRSPFAGFGNGDGACVQVPGVPSKLDPRGEVPRAPACVWGVDITGIQQAGRFLVPPLSPSLRLRVRDSPEEKGADSASQEVKGF